MSEFSNQNYSDVINGTETMHNGQYRKGTQIPYLAHVYGVAFSLV